MELKKLEFPKAKKGLQYHLVFVYYNKKHISRLAEDLTPFYKLLVAETLINKTSELKQTFDSVNKVLSDACELALKQPLPGKQLVLMIHESFRNTGYALMIEDNKEQKVQSKRKTNAPVTVVPKIKNVPPAQLTMSFYCKGTFTNYMVFLEYAQISWEVAKPPIVFRDNNSVTVFFGVPPSPWNACDCVLQNKFEIAHNAVSASTAAEIFSTLELKVTETIRLKIREDK